MLYTKLVFGAAGSDSAFTFSGAIIATIVAIISNDVVFVIIDVSRFVIYLAITIIDYEKTISLHGLYRNHINYFDMG
ncbi:hypothetical protein YTPLAS73_03960 [Nitrosarchaeum sp.]|nr:hypothetical protein YTPLAS73_03960 [Nitrosarchaeum sp.]